MSSSEIEPKLFISYSWTNQAHQAWVVRFAEELVSQGIDVVLDVWHLEPGHDANAFMEGMVTDPTVNKVLMISDAVYAAKSDSRAGGAGTEAQIITPEIFSKSKQDKFAAVVREKDSEGSPYLPTYYKGRIYFDLTNPSNYSSEFDRIIRWAWGKPLFVRPDKGPKPQFIDEKRVAGRISSSIEFRHVKEAITSYASNAVPLLDDYLRIIVSGLESFRLKFDGKKGGNFDDLVVESIDEFTPYRDELIGLMMTAAQHDVDDPILVCFHRFFEKCIPYLHNSPESGAWHDYDFDNFKFIVHELFLYCVGAFLKFERFDSAAYFLNNEYYWDTNFDRNNKMHNFEVFREHIGSLENRNQRLSLRRLSIRADMLRERNKGTGVEFQYIMAADFTLYLRSQNQFTYWRPETLLFSTRSGGVFEMFARSKSKRYFAKLTSLLGVSNKDQLVQLLKSIQADNRIPVWQFERIEPATLVGIDNICTTD